MIVGYYLLDLESTSQPLWTDSGNWKQEKQMINKRFVTFGLLIALVLIPLFSSTAYAQTYFSDNFENPAESEDKWEAIAGDWQVSNGVYHQLSTADPWQASVVATD